MDEQNDQKETEKPKISILEETKALVEELKKEKEEISKIKEELQQLRSDQLLSGTAGGHIEPEPPKVDTPQEYSDKVMSGQIKAQ